MPFENELPLDDQTVVFRCIPRGINEVRWLLSSAEPTVTSGNFKSDNQLSFHIAHMTTLEQILKDHEDFGLVSITVKELRAVLSTNLEKICADPEDDPPDPAHKIVCAKVTNGM